MNPSRRFAVLVVFNGNQPDFLRHAATPAGVAPTQ